MNQYLVMYQPPNDNKYYPSLHIWPEILSMLIKAEEFGGDFKLYRLDKVAPERVWGVSAGKGIYYLADMYKNHIEG